MSLGKLTMGHLLNWLFGKGSPTTPAGVLWVSLHTGDPGSDGQAANEVTGSGYAAKATSASDWSVATDADPCVVANATEIEFAAATGSWSSGASITHFGLFRHATTRTEANFVGRGALETSRVITTGNIARFEAGALTSRLLT